MPSVYVIRKADAGLAFPMGGGAPSVMYQPSSTNSGSQLVPGINPKGMAGLQQNPMTGGMEAKPQMDASGKNEIGVYQGDKYGAGALRQMNPEATANPETALENAQTVFDRGSKWGQRAHGVGQGLSAVAGVLGAGVSLANAGAQGQDLVSGGMNAAQMGQVAQQTVKKPLTEGLGNAAANLAGRVGVAKPVVADPTPQVAVASPTTDTHTQEQMLNMSGANHNMSSLVDAPIDSNMARTAAHRATWGVQPAEVNQVPVDHMGMPTAVGVEETGMVTGGGDQSTFQTGSQQGDEIAQARANQVKVAPATTSTMTDDTAAAAIGAETGQGQLPGAPDPNADSAAADEIKANTLAAKAMSGNKNPSMVDNGIGKMVGVSGSKRMVGVY